MPARIVIQPVVVVGGLRQPLCNTLDDIGRPVRVTLDDGTVVNGFKPIAHVSTLSSGLPGQRNNDCLSLVVAQDLRNLDAASGVTILFEAGSDQPISTKIAWLVNNTPNSLGWNAQKRNRVLARLSALGVSITGLGATTPLYQIANRLGQLWSPTYDVRQIPRFIFGG